MTPGLPPRDAALVDLSASLAADPGGVARRLQNAIAAGATPVEVEEVLLQSYLFVGYPTCLEAFEQWRRLGFEAPRSAVAPDWEAWRERGEGVCKRVYGGQYRRLRENVVALHPDLEEWMVAEGYGKVLGRPQLDLRTRELCIVALLAVIAAPRQLHSHLRGALQVGAGHAEVEEALERAARLTFEDRRGAALAVWQRVVAREASAGSEAGPAESKS